MALAFQENTNNFGANMKEITQTYLVKCMICRKVKKIGYKKIWSEGNNSQDTTHTIDTLCDEHWLTNILDLDFRGE